MENKIEVYSLDELPITADGMKYFACIGGNKNYECFLESKKLSRADFMKLYSSKLDKCHAPIYEDKDIIICQDAQIAIPGFYIIATKECFKKISFMNMELYKKCMYFASVIKKYLLTEFGIENAYIYYDEHYSKPSSTHFWVMPIYDDVIINNNLNPTILKYDIWQYQDLFQFQNYKGKIYEINEKMRKILEAENKKWN